jgi:hypothetical protein
MTMMTFLRSLFKFKKKKTKKNVEYVEDSGFMPSAEDQAPESLAKELLGEVDFSHRGDLEAYVRTLTVPRQVIERWVSAGLLFPEEMVMAERMIKIMLKNEQEQPH